MNGVDSKEDDLHILLSNGKDRDETKGNSMVHRS